MPKNDATPDGRSQDFTFPRRALLQKTASVALLFFAPHSQPALVLPEKYPAPRFNIGDKILSFWPDDEDLPPELGEIVGICWHPKNEQWKYLINWTGGDAADWMYPCFDEALVDESSLRLVNHV